MDAGAAVLEWLGPFPLDESVLGDPALPTAAGGVYCLMGWTGLKGRLPAMPPLFSGRPRPLYIGQTKNPFTQRLREHTQLSNGPGAKVLEIARRRHLFDSVMLVRFQDPTIPSLVHHGDQTGLNLVEGLLIWLFDPPLNHSDAPTPRVPPAHSLLLLNRFNQQTWAVRAADWPEWRPDNVADIIEFDVERQHARLTWMRWHTSFKSERWAAKKGDGLRPLRRRPEVPLQS